MPDEFHHAPSPEDIVKLYQRAHILLKASVYDARSCAPVEAMACGTPTARALHLGDDDLINGINCLRCDYNEEQLKAIAGRLVEDADLRAELAANGLAYRKRWLSWERWIEVVEKTMLYG